MTKTRTIPNTIEANKQFRFEGPTSVEVHAGQGTVPNKNPTLPNNQMLPTRYKKGTGNPIVGIVATDAKKKGGPVYLKFAYVDYQKPFQIGIPVEKFNGGRIGSAQILSRTGNTTYIPKLDVSFDQALKSILASEGDTYFALVRGQNIKIGSVTNSDVLGLGMATFDDSPMVDPKNKNRRITKPRGYYRDDLHFNLTLSSDTISFPNKYDDKRVIGYNGANIPNHVLRRIRSIRES